MTPEEMQELIQLRAEKAKRERKANGVHANGLTVRVSEKGAISVYGLMRFPITLYADAWLKLFTIVDTIRTFIDTNADKLSTKSKAA